MTVLWILLFCACTLWSQSAVRLEAGQHIPTFRLADQNGHLKSFDDLSGPNGAMLVFHRSADWCAYCKTQLVELNENRQRLAKRGLGIAAISYDSVAILKNFSDRKQVSIPLLSDPDSRVIRSFGLLNEAVPANSPFFGVPHPATLVVNKQGVIVSVHADEDFRRRITVGGLLGEPGTVSNPSRTSHLVVDALATDKKVHGGDKIRLIVNVKLEPRMHVYAPGVEGYIPLSWSIGANQPLEALPVTFPQSKILHLAAINEKVPVFEKSFTLSREVVIGDSRVVEPALTSEKKLRIAGSLRVQACDDKKCFLPEDIPLSWLLDYEPHDNTRVPPELRKVK